MNLTFKQKHSLLYGFILYCGMIQAISFVLIIGGGY